MAQPERRKTTTIQRISLALDIGALISIASLAFWTGRQAQRIDEMAEGQKERDANVAQVQATVNNTAARVDVVEVKAESTTTLVRDMKADVGAQLRRIEDKLDAGRRR